MLCTPCEMVCQTWQNYYADFYCYVRKFWRKLFAFTAAVIANTKQGEKSLQEEIKNYLDNILVVVVRILRTVDAKYVNQSTYMYMLCGYA